MVLPTGSGELRRTHGVKAILHVAGQHGEPGKGYLPIRNYTTCIHHALEAAERLSSERWARWRYGGPLRSILFPLFGTRSSDRNPQDVAGNMVRAAKTFLEARPNSTTERVYFLAYTDADQELCETAFSHLRFKDD